MTLFEEKSKLRTFVLNRLNALTVEQIDLASNQIQKNISDFLFHKSGVWGAFQPLNNEPQINWNQVSESIEWAFPLMNKEQKLTFKKNPAQFSKTQFGLSQPMDGEDYPINQLVGVVVPAVAFDRKGYRLGRGKGYYDKSLKDFNGLKLGVCFNENLLTEVPAENHDIQFDVVFTELETVVLRKK